MQLANISSTKHLDSVGLMHEKSFWNLKMTQTSLQRRLDMYKKNCLRFHSQFSLNTYWTFFSPILQHGQVGGILLPLQISSQSLGPTRQPKLKGTTRNPSLSAKMK